MHQIEVTDLELELIQSLLRKQRAFLSVCSSMNDRINHGYQDQRDFCDGLMAKLSHPNTPAASHAK